MIWTPHFRDEQFQHGFAIHRPRERIPLIVLLWFYLMFSLFVIRTISLRHTSVIWLFSTRKIHNISSRVRLKWHDFLDNDFVDFKLGIAVTVSQASAPTTNQTNIYKHIPRLTTRNTRQTFPFLFSRCVLMSSKIRGDEDRRVWERWWYRMGTWHECTHEWRHCVTSKTHKNLHNGHLQRVLRTISFHPARI
jgi:hypothetical protein